MECFGRVLRLKETHNGELIAFRPLWERVE